jgi:hypothetical protein
MRRQAKENRGTSSSLSIVLSDRSVLPGGAQRVLEQVFWAGARPAEPATVRVLRSTPEEA